MVEVAPQLSGQRMTKLLPFAWPTVFVSKIKICQTQRKYYISANKLLTLLHNSKKKRSPLSILLLTDETHKVRMHRLSSLQFRLDVRFGSPHRSNEFINKPIRQMLVRSVPKGSIWDKLVLR